MCAVLWPLALRELWREGLQPDKESQDEADAGGQELKQPASPRVRAGLKPSHSSKKAGRVPCHCGHLPGGHVSCPTCESPQALSQDCTPVRGVRAEEYICIMCRKFIEHHATRQALVQGLWASQ